MKRYFNFVVVFLIMLALSTCARADEVAVATGWLSVLSALYAFANAPVGITLIASGVLWLLNKLYNAKPEWQQYEGTIITAIKWAEANIPDNTGNSSITKFDSALKYVLDIYAKRNQIAVSSIPVTVVASLSEGINLLHAQAESRGLLHASRAIKKSEAGKL
jgi:hypothetical protein